MLLAVVLATTHIQFDDRPPGFLASAYAQDDLPSDTNEAANVLFVRALQAIADADIAGTAAARLALLQQAQTDLDRIVRDYPGADLAVQIISQQRIGAFDPRELIRDIRSAERAAAREIRRAEREAARQAQDAAIEAERAQGFAAAELERAAICPDRPDPCALLADAMATVERMPREIYRIRALSQVAGAHATIGLVAAAGLAFADAEQLADEIPGYHWRDNGRWSIAIGQAEGGLFEEARATTGEINDDLVRALALSSIASRLAGADDLEQAEATFAEAVNLVVGVSEAWDNPEDTHKWLRDLSHIAVEQARSGFVESAQLALAHLSGVEVVTAHGDALLYLSQVQVLADIGLATAIAGLADEASEAFTDALTAALVIDDDGDRRFALIRIVHAQADAGFFEDARAWVAETVDADLRDQLLRAIAANQAHASLFDDALTTAGAIASPEVRRSALWTVAGAQANADLLTDALETLAEADALTVTHEAERPGGRIWALARIARAEAAAGHIDEARRRFADAMVGAEAVDDDIRPGYALEYIAEAQAEAAASVFRAD